MEEYSQKLDEAQNFADIFEMVKDLVMQKIGNVRGGLNLGLMELGNSREGWLGGFYPTGSNIIVMNKTPLRRLAETKPSLVKPYVFMVLLHEYLHSLGYLDEKICRGISYKICREVFGEKHDATEMAYDISSFMKYITYPEGFPQLDKDIDSIQVIENIDKESDFYFG
ncbi:MAG: hypothetical protein HYW25_00085 [Candidatus Aenigmarchaeota archaeon]|nr:hypothetical protein [Candidatus Aenigmarchaeota archaeon]